VIEGQDGQEGMEDMARVDEVPTAGADLKAGEDFCEGGGGIPIRGLAVPFPVWHLL